MATAFASLVSLQNTLLLVYNHPRHHFSFNYVQLRSLWGIVSLWIDFIRSSDDKEAVEAYEGRIARAAQAAEDVLESHVADQIRRGTTLVGDRNRFIMLKMIKEFDLKIAHTAYRVNRGLALGESMETDVEYLGRLMLGMKVVDQDPILGPDRRSHFLPDLEKAIQEMGYIRREPVNLQNCQSGSEENQPTFSATTSSTPLPPRENRMVGFDDELLQLLDKLTRVPSSRQVISILGMGGIGKTTLARNVFHHKLISEHFDICLWATVSLEFSVHKILTELLSCFHSEIKEETSLLPKTTTDVSGFGDLGIKLHKTLFGRRYLIVLDDMWSVQPWDKLKSFFPDTSNGSRIIVTTRQFNVANDLQNWQLYMRVLDEDKSWDLFCERTFEEQGCPPELEEVGKKIVEKCKGLPLAIAVIAGHLRKSARTAVYWKTVENDMGSVLNHAKNEECFKILSLSYRYLPIHLKPCFLLLGVFQEDEDIRVKELIDLWIGEGFIEHDENYTMKYVAFTYLVDLRLRNLISVREIGGFEAITCRVHDVVRELCLKIAKKDGFLSARRAMNRMRQVAAEGEFPRIDATKLVNEVNFQQVNLRSIKLKVCYQSYLLPSISLLWNLQTLIINGSIIAPYEIWEMPQLRLIEVDQLSLPDPLPLHSLDEENGLIMEKMNLLLVMKNLRTLSKVDNFRLSEEVLRRIPYIKELKLSYHGEPSSDYCLHNLVCFQELASLECYFDRSIKWRNFAFSLALPNSLQKLLLSGCHLEWEELGVKVGSLPHLKYLELFPNSVSGSEWTPIEGGFPCLNDLLIFSRDLIHWNADKSHFPVLENISLFQLTKLDEFPSDIGEIPTLSYIRLVGCSMSASISAMRMVAKQEEMGNEGLRLRVIFEGDEQTIEGFKQKVEEEGLTSKNIHLQLKKLKSKGS